MLASGAEALVVRTSGVLGRRGSAQKGGSFVDRILAQARAGKPLRVVADQVFAPTQAGDLAGALVALVRLGRARALPRHEPGLVLVARARHGRARGRRPRASGRGDRAPPSCACPRAARPTRCSTTRAASALGLPPLRPWQDALAELVA